MMETFDIFFFKKMLLFMCLLPPILLFMWFGQRFTPRRGLNKIPYYDRVKFPRNWLFYSNCMMRKNDLMNKYYSIFFKKEPNCIDFPRYNWNVLLFFIGFHSSIFFIVYFIVVCFLTDYILVVVLFWLAFGIIISLPIVEYLIIYYFWKKRKRDVNLFLQLDEAHKIVIFKKIEDEYPLFFKKIGSEEKMSYDNLIQLIKEDEEKIKAWQDFLRAEYHFKNKNDKNDSCDGSNKNNHKE